MRSSACDTLARLCARRVLCWFAFPLATALAISPFRGSITHPTQSLCTLRGRSHRRLTQHSLPGGLLGLTWAGLAPADRASFAWRLQKCGLGQRTGVSLSSPAPCHVAC